MEKWKNSSQTFVYRHCPSWHSGVVKNQESKLTIEKLSEINLTDFYAECFCPIHWIKKQTEWTPGGIICLVVTPYSLCLRAAIKFVWVRTTPLGTPVVPLEKRMSAASSRGTMAGLWNDCSLLPIAFSNDSERWSPLGSLLSSTNGGLSECPSYTL